MFEHENLTNAAMLASYKERGLEESLGDSWFLELMMTDPMYEGQGSLDVGLHLEAAYTGVPFPNIGVMSALVREAFANASPRDTFALDSSTTASRDRYLHLGFEVSHNIIPIFTYH
jgi:hypothetical protein